MQAGQVLARLDPTFAAADVGALAAQVASSAGAGVAAAGGSRRPAVHLYRPRSAIWRCRRRSSPAPGRVQLQARELHARRSTASCRPSRKAQLRRGRLPQPPCRWRPASRRCGATSSSCRSAASSTRWPRWTTGPRWSATCDSAEETANSAQRDLAAHGRRARRLRADLARRHLGEAGRGHRQAVRCARVAEQGAASPQLVELRADRDATVLTVAKVSVGSVLQSGQQFITLVPADAPLEVEANISGRDDGFVHVGDPVAIKFDTFPYHPVRPGLRHGAHRSAPTASPRRTNSATRPARCRCPPTAASLFYRARIAIDRVDTARHARRLPHRCPACR